MKICLIGELIEIPDWCIINHALLIIKKHAAYLEYKARTHAHIVIGCRPNWCVPIIDMFECWKWWQSVHIAASGFHCDDNDKCICTLSQLLVNSVAFFHVKCCAIAMHLRGPFLNQQSLCGPFQRLMSRALVHFSHWNVSQVPIHTSIQLAAEVAAFTFAFGSPTNGIRSEFLPAARVFWKYHRNVAKKGGAKPSRTKPHASQLPKSRDNH